MNEPGVDRRRAVRVDVDREVMTVIVDEDKRQLETGTAKMLNVGVGGCALGRAFPPSTRVGVLVRPGLLLVGRVMPGSVGEPVARLEWAPTPEDAAEVAAEFGIPSQQPDAGSTTGGSTNA